MYYIIRRLLQTLLVIFGVSIVSFGLMFLTGDPTELLLGAGADFMTHEEIEAYRHAMGFDRPWIVQYADFAAGVVRGDFGDSLMHHRPAFSVVIERMPATVQLALIALAISVIFAIPIGVISATRPNSWYDYVSMTGALIGQSVPSFWLGILLMLFFGVYLKWLPISGRGTWQHLILPGFTLAAFSLARNARLTRSSLLEVMQQDYMRTARAKGLTERPIVYRHGLRNALIPLVTMIGLQVGFLLGGSVIIETIFAWPGIGRLIIQSIYNKDFPVVQAGVTLLAIIFVLVNLLVDLIYAWLDPRVQYN
ncbi:MAG: nickel ABC transporter permease [Chloroflexota bacterium]